MKIIIVNDNAVISGGATKCALLSAEHLAAAGHEVHYVHGLEGVDPYFEGLGTIKFHSLGRPNTDMTMRKLIDLSYLDSTYNKVRELIAQGDPKKTIVHSHLWKTLSNPGKRPEGKLAKEIDEAFGTYEKWKEEMTKTAMGVFGSGWAWFARNKEGKLFIKAYPNQDSPLMESATLIYGIDVWEHAYYLKHQNRRAEYVKTSLEITAWTN